LVNATICTPSTTIIWLKIKNNQGKKSHMFYLEEMHSKQSKLKTH
jgi:hypothetical protein